MKNFNRFVLLAVFTFTASILTAQLNVQATRWVVPGKQINFNNYPATATTMTTGAVQDGINSYTYMDGPVLFQIVNDKIKSVSGTNLATLGNSTGSRGPEYATTEVKNDCNTFLTFYLEREYTGLVTNEKLCYSKYSRDPLTGTITMSTNGYALQTEGSDAYGGIAMSKERPDGSRFLYYASTSNWTRGYIKKYTISASGTVDSGVEIYTGVSNQPFRMSELELSHDGSRLAFSRTDVSGNCNVNHDVVIFELNPTTGNLSNSTPITINLRSNDAALDYPGIEFSADGQNLYVLAQSGSLYKIIMSNYSTIEFTSFNSQYCNSQLELGRDGWYYLAKSDGLYRMDNNGNVSTFSSGTMAYNDLMALRGHTVYVLPDQIDGQDYKNYVTNTNCCYEHRESNFISMTGVSENTTTGDITITGSNVSWTQSSNPFTSGSQAITDIYLKGNLTINVGAKLKIDGLTLHFKEAETLDMSYNASGVGSRLELRNSTLTAFDDCDGNAMWGGIRCNGYWASVPQGGTSTSPQPYTYMFNSTIEFADKGIEANNGGIVKAYNSYFKDNIRDLKFASYSYQGVDNISLFSDCDFHTTNEYYDKGNTSPCHVEIWTAPGLAFYGCKFRNACQSPVSISQSGIGILSTNSSITVKEKCSGFQLLGYPCADQYTTRGEFTDLYYAIKANSGSFMTLSRQDFNNCVKGSWLIDCDAIKVTECDFDVSSETLSSDLYDSFGLYVESSTGYHIEGNEFHDGVLGLVVLNSGEDENLVYRNDFENLSGNGQATGFVGLGINYDYTDKYGLQLWCNDFIDVDYAMAVLGGDVTTPLGGTASITQSDIRSTQGMEFYGYLDKSTYNYFSGIPIDEDRYFIVDPNVSNVGYNYWYNQTDAPGYRLEEYASNITVSNESAETCPQTIYTYGGIIIPLMETIGGLNDEEIALENELSELTSYDEIALEISAQTATESNTSEVYISLYEESPNLTSEILLAYLNNTSVSELSRASLMIANSPLPTDVVEAVNESDLSSAYKAHILKYQNGKNLLEQKQNRINSLKSARQVNYDKLTMATFESDSTPNFADTYDMVLGFMETQTDTHAKKKLADMYIHKGLFDNALSILCDLENIALSTENTALYNDVKLKEIKIDINRTHSIEATHNVIVENEEYLRELASDYITKEGGAARAMLESAGLWDNFPIVFLPNPKITIEDRSAIIDDKIDELIPELESLFSIYPNPADNYLSIEFINPEGNCSFSIFSIKGELIKTVTSNQSLGFISIDISNLESGNYIITCQELNESQNFMIVR